MILAKTQEKPPPAIVLLMAMVVVLPLCILTVIKSAIAPVLVVGCAAAIFASWRKWLSAVRSAWTAFFVKRGEHTADTDDKAMTATPRFECFRKSFAAARLTDGQDQLLEKYKRRYGHRPGIIGLVQRAYDETCAD